MPARNLRETRVRTLGLGDYAELFFQTPAPPTLNSGDDLHRHAHPCS
jgi:hypothetical protein